MTNTRALRIQSMICLDSRVAIYVPGTINVNEEADTRLYVAGAAKLLSKCFGGASAHPVTGFWVDDETGELITENTTVVYAGCDADSLAENEEKILEYCQFLKTELGQQAIALELNGQMAFI